MKNILTNSPMKRKTNLDRLREIKRDFQAKKIGRFLVDANSANAMLMVHSSLSDKNKLKYENLINSNIPRAATIAWKLVK